MGKADSVFEIIGSIMIGPSSSHTAAAVRIGLICRALVGEPITQVLIQLHGSYASTGKQHGTDKGITAGLLGFDAADERIPQALDLAKETGMSVKFRNVDLGNEYPPNTARLLLEGKTGAHIKEIVVYAAKKSIKDKKKVEMTLEGLIDSLEGLNVTIKKEIKGFGRDKNEG